MNGIPSGTYLPGDSFVHKLDGRAKLVMLLAVMIAAIFADSWIGYAVIVIYIVAFTALSGLPMGTALGSVKRLKWFFVIIFLMNLCFFSPVDAWVSVWIFTPSYAGLIQGFSVVFRVMVVVVMGNIVTGATPPMQLTAALEWLISPLRFIGIPTGQIAMIISVAIQFIPTLFEETEMIRKAQTARGAMFDSHRLTQRAGAVMPLAIPIFLGAFQRADELALAMEARGYRTTKRAAPKRFGKLALFDCLALAVSAALCALEIIL